MLDLATNPLKNWIATSREEERRAPQRYLSYYADRVTCDEKYAFMMRNTLDEMKRNCGEYNGTTPTGEYCGKIFVREGFIVWFGICKVDPMTRIQWNFREIRIIDE
jgi:hypothetical protein